VFHGLGSNGSDSLEEGTISNEDNNLSFDNNMKFVPVNKCLMTTLFTIEEHVLTVLVKFVVMQVHHYILLMKYGNYSR